MLEAFDTYIDHFQTGNDNNDWSPQQAHQSTHHTENIPLKQINTSIIQIENEYYSSIRPKRVTPPGERPINILRNELLEYTKSELTTSKLAKYVIENTNNYFK